MPRLPVLALLALAACAAAPKSVRSGEYCQLAPPPEVRYLRLGEIGAFESLEFIAELTASVEAKVPEVRVTIDSPGGSVSTMFEIIDLMRKGRAQGMVVECKVDGLAASAAAIFLQAACSERAMTRASQLMFHEPAMGGEGKEWDFRRAADHLADTNRRVATLIAWRMGMTADEYEAWIKDRNRWEDAAGALAKGFVDTVVP